ncbi:hypothetical protein CALCODRAFT_489867 [Calocera cornea HHB12733]|uniref:Uncharacterized protein n=1 Tax=Calocera cornea HHB12733 TaxID=1353952 RepID=A0A165K057_9BASI|nr:hypothetical protein CALCODRAFT_489867 [Calocera cornea HHB12733]
MFFAAQTLRETGIELPDLPASKGQIKLAQHLIQNGAPKAEEVHEGMARGEMDVWIVEANKNVGLRLRDPLPPTVMNMKATDPHLQHARDLAASSGLEIPYNEAHATYEDVASFVRCCRRELVRLAKPPKVSTERVSNRQRDKLEVLGVTLPEGATWAEAHERILELNKPDAAAAGPGETDGVTLTPADEEVEDAQVVPEREVVEESTEVGAIEEIEGAESEEESVEVKAAVESEEPTEESTNSPAV